MSKATFAACALALAAIVCSNRPAQAQVNPNEPKILLHVMATTSKNPCTTYFTTAMPNCESADVTATAAGDGSLSYFVYVVVARGDSMQTLSGLQLGVTYDTGDPTDIADGSGIDMFAWILCATLEFATPPHWTNGGAAPGGGNLITWDSSNRCQTGEVAAAGYFYVTAYSDSKLEVTVRPVDDAAKVADCQASEVIVSEGALGYAQFSTSGTVEGCNPCLENCAPVATKSSTWSGVKTLFNNN
jgi:hypothetical protein